MEPPIDKNSAVIPDKMTLAFFLMMPPVDIES